MAIEHKQSSSDLVESEQREIKREVQQILVEIFGKKGDVLNTLVVFT